MEDRKYCVYMHKNKTNGKVYIGITSISPNNRWRNGVGYTGQKFGNAIKKYGWDGFEHIILYENLSIEDASKKEIELIRKYDSRNNAFGYNVAIGGANVYNYSEENIKRASECMSGSKNPMSKKIVCNDIIFGCLKDCAEHYGVDPDKMSKWARGKCNSPQKFYDMKLHYFGEKILIKTKGKIYGKKKVYCDGVIYESAKHCSDFYNVKECTMIKWLNKTNRIPKEFIDRNLHYVGEEPNNSCILDNRVICDDIMFDNSNDCAQYYNVNANTLRSWINGNLKMPKSFYDMGLRKIGLNAEIKVQEGRKTGEKAPNARKVYCKELDMEFASIKICSEYFYNELNINVFRPHISAVLAGKQNHTKGYTFKYIDN